jgi:hypothetical protein
MTLLKFDRNLTADATTNRLSDTHAGQAHIAGTGPVGKTCRECSHWRRPPDVPRHEYYRKRIFEGATLKPHACGKTASLTGRAGDRVPHDARACKYFEQADCPPPVSDKR